MLISSILWESSPEPQATTSLLPSLPKPSSISEKLRQLFADQPLAFELNIGQADPRIDFSSRSGQVFLSAGSDAAVPGNSGSCLPARTVAKDNWRATVERTPELPARKRLREVADRCADTAPRHLQGIYSGIDLTYYGNHHEIEYDFKIAPGSDRVRFGWRLIATSSERSPRMVISCCAKVAGNLSSTSRRFIRS